MRKKRTSADYSVTRLALIYAGVALLLALGLALGGVAVQWGQLQPEDAVQTLLSVQLIPYQTLLMLMAGGLAILSWFAQRAWLIALVRTTVYFGGVLGLGLLFLVWWEGYQVLVDGRLPLTNLFEVSHLLLSLVALYGLWLMRRTGQQGFLPYVGGLVVLCAGWVLWLEGLDQAGPRHVVPALQSYWLPAHVLANFLAYATFTVAAGAGAMALMARKPQAAVDAERMAFRAVSLGFPLFTLAIVLGSLWAYEAWGGTWSWDPKETWALVTWLVYASYLHARLQGRFSTRALAWGVVLAWGVMMFCFLGVNLLLSGLHSYGQLA